MNPRGRQCGSKGSPCQGQTTGWPLSCVRKSFVERHKEKGSWLSVTDFRLPRGWSLANHKTQKPFSCAWRLQENQGTGGGGQDGEKAVREMTGQKDDGIRKSRGGGL